ncbi:DUF6311 domain-containing protein [Flavitalea flava]
MKNIRLYTATLIAVVVIFQITYGLHILVPSNVSWLMEAMHDWGTHYLGWFFYRNEPWHFPLGHITGYYYPIGTNVGFTDSIPLLAIFFKLFSPVLSADFQYFGLWLFSCHALAAWFTIRLFRLFHVGDLYTFIAVLFVVANPVLVYRGLHPALCAHWLLIGSIYFYFLDPSTGKVSRILRSQFILLFLSALINPYLCFMVLGFSIIIPLKLCFFDKKLGRKIFFLYLSASLVCLLVSWYIIGMITFGKKEDLGVQGGFGLYSLNLNSLYNSTGWSSIFSGLKQVSWHQYEGFMYLGAGMFLLLFLLLVYGIKYGISENHNRHPFRNRLILNNTQLVPLLILVLLYTLFSVTHIISINDKVLLKIPIPDAIIKAGEIFRASSRFFWVPFYLIVLFSLIAVSKSRINVSVKSSILIFALLLQFYDIRPLLTLRHLSSGPYPTPLNKNWNAFFKNSDEITLYPPYQATYNTNLDYQFFCYLAAQNKKPINTGYVARVDNHSVNFYTDSLIDKLEDGRVSPKALYITTASGLPRFFPALQKGALKLNSLDGYYYLYTNDSKNSGLLALSEQLNMGNTQTLDSFMNRVGIRNEFKVIPQIANLIETKLIYNLEKLKTGENYLHPQGWAIEENNLNNKGDSIFILLRSDNKAYIAPVTIQARPDITSHFKAPYLDDAGFDGIISTNRVESGNYRLCIAIRNRQGKIVFQETSNIIGIHIADHSTPEKISSLPPQGNIIYNFDRLESDSAFINAGGWAAFKDQDAVNCKISILLRNGDQIYQAETNLQLRPDVAAANPKYKFTQTGFNVSLLKDSLPDGTYQLGILINDIAKSRKGVVFSDKQIKIQQTFLRK